MPARKTKSTPETPPVVKSIKGFNRDLTCRKFQFEIGQTYTTDGEIEACRNGFHACPIEEHPFSVFGFYAPSVSRYCEVEIGGKTDCEGTKIAGAQITIGVEITIPELVQRAWAWVWDRATKSDDAHVTADQGAASSTGYQGAASSTGYQGAASSTGYKGAASSTGDYGAAMASGYAGRVMGADGNALFAVERNGNFEIVSAASGIVGRDGIKSNHWYVCKDGALVEAN